MRQAFDTIKRKKLVEVMIDAKFTKEEIKLVKFLLSNTKIKVKINKAVSDCFMTSKGSFQGDSISGALFTLYLSGALKALRGACSRNKTKSDSK